MGGSVGGWTSFLELRAEPDGFNQAKTLISDLRKQLKQLKAEAGNLGSMKLKISIENPMDDELKKFKERKDRLSKDQQVILRSYKNEGELAKENKASQALEEKKKKEDELRERQAILMSYRNDQELDKENKAKKKQEEEDKNNKEKQRQSYIDSTKESLNNFATMIKWTTGIIVGFGSALAIATMKNASDNTNTANAAQSVNMDPFKYLALQQVGKVYGNSDNAFSNILLAMRKFKTDPTLYGNLDSQQAIGLATGTGTKIDKKFFDMKEEDMAKVVIDNAMKKYIDAQKSGDYATLSKVSQFISSSYGQELLNTIIGMTGRGQNTVEGAQGYIESGLVKPDFKASKEFNFLSNDIMSKLENQLNTFLTYIESMMIKPLSDINDWLRSNKDSISNFGKGLIDFAGALIQFIGGLTSFNLTEMSKGASKINKLRDKAVYGEDAIKKGMEQGLVKETDNGYEFFNPNVNNGLLVPNPNGQNYNMPTLPGDNLKWVSERLERLRNEAYKMAPGGMISIDRVIDSAHGNLMEARNQLEKLFKDPGFRNNLQGVMPDESAKRIRELSLISFMQSNQQQRDNVFNVDLKVDWGSQGLTQTIRQQNTGYTSKLAQFNMSGGAIA